MDRLPDDSDATPKAPLLEGDGVDDDATPLAEAPTEPGKTVDGGAAPSRCCTESTSTSEMLPVPCGVMV